MRLRRLLVRALDPGFGLILIHSFIRCPLTLPRVWSLKLHLFHDDIFRELVQRVSGWQDRLQEVQFVGVKTIGELDMKFDVEVTWFVVSLRGHTLTVDDLQVAWRVSSVKPRWRQHTDGLTIADNLDGEDINNKSTIIQVTDSKGATSEG